MVASLFSRRMRYRRLYKRNHWWLTGEYESSIDFASGIAPVLFCDANRYASIVDLCRPTFKRKLTSSINDRAKATSCYHTNAILLSNKTEILFQGVKKFRGYVLNAEEKEKKCF